MTPFLWRLLVWASFALALSAHFFLSWDASDINNLQARVAELEEKLEQL